MDFLKLQAYAKINLSLDVLRQRQDGYHDVRMVMQTIRLHDNVDLRRIRQPGIRLRTNLSFLPVNENNLMYRAAQLLIEEFKLREGVEMTLRKVIPVAAGLAGGSADAAAVLYGVNRIFSLGLSAAELQKRAVRLGADVPFCLMHGTALSEGIGEVLTALPGMPECMLVLAKPGISVSTKYVYTNLRVDAQPPEAHPDISRVVEALHAADLRGIAENAGNILERVSCREYPEIDRIKERILSYGALFSLMSGSGPTVFGVFDDPDRAEHCYQELRFGKDKNIAKQVYLTEPWK